MPISQERLLEIERELAVIVRELDRFEKTRPKKPEQAVQFPIVGSTAGLALCKKATSASLGNLTKNDLWAVEVG